MLAATFRQKTSFDREDLLRCARGEIFGPENGKLPLPNMLMFDRISSVDREAGRHGLGQVVAEFDISPDLWFFQCHFMGDPVMPGCLGLDAMWQLLGFFLTWKGCKGRGRALGVGEVKFRGQVKPTVRQVRYTIDVRRVLERKFTLGIGDGVLEADDKPIYYVEGLRVGLFTDLDDSED
jgi:3-hydroxyacyl-[acyl-carrier protein] dehydratase/trans-2-decenoyl-[acyl-carrier protein] isomerase